MAALPAAMGFDHHLGGQQAVSRPRPTMKEVAEHAKVSLSTVSYVVNNSGPVAADRRARVIAAVRELRYTPNEAARRLKRRSALAIGLFVPDLMNQFFALLAQGVERAATERDVLVLDQQSARAHFAGAGGACRRAPPRTRSACSPVGWPARSARDSPLCS